MTRHLLEADQRLSSSLLWQLQRRVYQELGVAAFELVPQYVTANAFIADAYARVVLGFLRDLAAGGVRAPVDLIELGAGTGRFAYLFLERLGELCAGTRLAGQRFRYLFTDLAEANLAHARQHPQLARLRDAGVLDFARFDVEHDGELALASGQVLSPGTARGPVVVLANYLFDAIPPDLFHVEAGRLYEGRVSVTSSDPVRPVDLEVAYRRAPAAAEPYQDPSWNRILDDYRRWLPDGAFSFPGRALACLGRLRRLAAGPFLALVGDKGYLRGDALLSSLEPALSLHGSFSMMLNFHAIAEWVRRQGGHVLEPAHRHASLGIAGYVLGADPIETRHAFAEHIEAHGPDDFFTLKQALEPHAAGFDLVQLLAVLRASRCDDAVLLALVPALREQIAGASGAMAADLRTVFRQAWRNHFVIGEPGGERDLALELAILCLEMDDPLEALGYLEHSRSGARALYTAALCHQHLGQRETARAWVARALAADPELGPARELAAELAGPRPATTPAPD